MLVEGAHEGVGVPVEVTTPIGEGTQFSGSPLYQTLCRKKKHDFETFVGGNFFVRHDDFRSCRCTGKKLIFTLTVLSVITHSETTLKTSPSPAGPSDTCLRNPTAAPPPPTPPILEYPVEVQGLSKAYEIRIVSTGNGTRIYEHTSDKLLYRPSGVRERQNLRDLRVGAASLVVSRIAGCFAKVLCNEC